ncbi:hypothetical protein CPB97_003663, partial [Podila verticillata]
DGYTVQVLAFKVRELLSVQYKCYPSEVLPDRLLTTTAGMGNFLAKVHNVFQTKEDVEHLLGCAADQADTISCLSNDLSQACIASAYSILPSDKELRIGRRRRHRGRKKRGSRGEQHINLAAKQKAATRPMLKHSAWMEAQKNAVLVEPARQDGVQPSTSSAKATTQAQEGIQPSTNNTEAAENAEPKSIIEIESALS